MECSLQKGPVPLILKAGLALKATEGKEEEYYDPPVVERSNAAETFVHHLLLRSILGVTLGTCKARLE